MVRRAWVPVRERRRRRIWRAACQSAIQGCDEIESKTRRFNRDIVIFAWQTVARELFHRHRPRSCGCKTRKTVPSP